MIPVFVISLLRSTERRARIAAQLEALGVRFSFFDAIDGTALPRHELEAARRVVYPARYGSPLLATELGCTESHRQVCARIAAGSEPFGCVLEDDVDLHSDVVRFLDAAWLQTLPPFDALRLQETDSSPVLTIFSHERFQLRAPYCLGWGTRAQIYTRQGAAKAAAGLANRSMPADHALFCDGLIRDLRVLEVHPPLAFHPRIDHHGSAIDPEGERQRPRDKKPLSWEVRHAVYVYLMRLRRLRNFVSLWGPRRLLRLRHRR